MSTEIAKAPTALPESVVRRGINESQWRTLFNLFPGGKPESVLLVWDYCKSRQLDPMKKPCHIVPMRVKGADGQWGWRDVVMPGIYEYRITAQRTGLYLGHTEPEYGEDVEFAGVRAPKWCAMTMYRWNEKAREKVPFPVRVFFAEVVATKQDGGANERWSKAPIQMLTKCTEAAGLREAFPEEFGGEPTAEEMEGRQIERETAAPATTLPQASTRRSAAVVEAPAAQESAAEPAPVVDADPNPEPSPSAPEPPPPTNPRIGTIVEVKEKSGSFLIKLSTGFWCATRDSNIADGAEMLRKTGTVVEVMTKPASDPKFAPHVVDFVRAESQP